MFYEDILICNRYYIVKKSKSVSFKSKKSNSTCFNANYQCCGVTKTSRGNVDLLQL